MSLFSLIGWSPEKRRQDADIAWLDTFTKRNVAESEAQARALADTYEVARSEWMADRLSAEKYGEMVRVQEAAEDAWELSLGNSAERWAATALQ